MRLKAMMAYTAASGGSQREPTSSMKLSRLSSAARLKGGRKNRPRPASTSKPIRLNQSRSLSGLMALAHQGCSPLRRSHRRQGSPQAPGIEQQYDQLSLWNQHPVHFPQELVGMIGELQRMGKQDCVDTVGGHGQVFEAGLNIPGTAAEPRIDQYPMADSALCERLVFPVQGADLK